MREEYADIQNLGPIDRVKVAQQLAVRSSRDAPLRKVADIIMRDVRNVPRDGPKAIAKWIRQNIRYAQESPGIEILQGPYHTLKYKIADCDDLAILWVTLTRAAGLETYFTGAGLNKQPGVLYHAVVYDAKSGLHYELTKDHRYLGGTGSGLYFTPPPDSFTVIYRTQGDGNGGYYVSRNPGYPYQPTTQRALTSGAYRRAPMLMGQKAPAPGSPYEDEEDLGAAALGGLGTVFREAPIAVVNWVLGPSEAQQPSPEQALYQDLPPAPAPPVSTGPSPLLIFGGLALAGTAIYLIARR